MPKDVTDFERTVDRIREGSQEAAWELVEQFSPYILRIVRRRLPERLRKKFDSQDFVQAVWASVFTNRSQLTRFHRSEEFVAFVAAVASNKVGMEIRRRFLRQKYNVNLERSLDKITTDQGNEFESRQPRPSQVAVARERWFQMLADQPDHYRQFIEMRYTGATFKEIADELGYQESTVRRAIKKIFREQRL